MSRTYAIPDLHGRHDLLEAALARIEARQSGGKVVFLGDYVDRGPASRQVLERLMAGPTDPRWTWVCLKGNHEQMMADCLLGRGTPEGASWLHNGGGQALLSYGHQLRGPIDLSVVPRDHAEWIDVLPLVHADGKRVFVHAGLDRAAALDAQQPAVALWSRLPRDEENNHPDGYVVHGHTPFRDGPVVLATRANLDTLAWATGRLEIGVFDDGADGGPVSVMSVRGPDIKTLQATG